jgi:hypothetical protein
MPGNRLKVATVTFYSRKKQSVGSAPLNQLELFYMCVFALVEQLAGGAVCI